MSSNASSTETRNRARAIILPSGITKVRRKKRFSAGALCAGFPSGYQIHWQPSKGNAGSIGEDRPFGVRHETATSHIA